MKNNRIMYKFKGTINGVEYTDKNKFFDALKKLDPKSRCRVKVDELEEKTTRTKENKPVGVDPIQKTFEKPAVHTTPGYEDLFSKLFGGLFLSFLKTQNTQLYNKLVAENRAEKPAVRPERDIRQIPAVSEQDVFQNITRTYFFPETTYVFKGTAEDDWHLDRFSELLAKRAKEIKAEDLSRLSANSLALLYKRSLDEYARISRCIEKVNSSLQEIDKDLAGLENVCKAYEAIATPVPDNIRERVERRKVQFEKLNNRKNYYLLLQEHYRNVGPYFDPER